MFTGPNIIDSDSIILATDRYNPNYRSDSYNALYIIGKNRSKTRVNNSAFLVPELDAIDASNTQRFTLAVWLEINAYNTGFAWHPVNKWNASGTASATIVLYAFQDYRVGGGGTVGDGLGNNNHGNYGFYYHRYNSNGWTGISSGTTTPLLGGLENRTNFPRKNFFVFTYDVNKNNSQPKMYINGQYYTQGPSAPNGLGNYEYTQGNLLFYNNYPNDTSEDINGVTWLQIYDRMITDEEVTKLYNHTKLKHGY
jgi:hypothetical protein